MSDTFKSRVPISVILVSIVLMMGVVATLCTNEFLASKQTSEWPTTTATIRSRPSSKHIIFEYAVKGERYTSSQVSLTESKRYAGEYTPKRQKQYPFDSQHPVAYNPADPSVAVLEPGADTLILVVPLLAIFVMLVVGIFGVSKFVTITKVTPEAEKNP